MRHRLALFDMDGVIADERHRAHFALERDWGNYFDPARVIRDGVWPQGLLAYQNEILIGSDAGYLTGRRVDIREVSTEWLRRGPFDHELPLIMRRMEHSTRGGWPLARLKAAIVEELLHVYDDVILYDDDPAVCEAVSQVQGAQVQHCTWHIKPERLVRRGVA